MHFWKASNESHHLSVETKLKPSQQIFLHVCERPNRGRKLHKVNFLNLFQDVSEGLCIMK